MENKYFKEALASMVTEVAYGDAVRRLHDKGYSAKDIQKNIDYPVSLEQINAYIQSYEVQKAAGSTQYEYIQKTDEFGRRSFIRVEKN